MTEHRDTALNKGSATPKQIVGCASYLIFVAAGAIAGLVILWPSCETTDYMPRAASGLQVTSISPAAGTSKGGTLVSIRGMGFADDAKVYFGEKEATDAKLVDTTHIRVASPEHGKGIVDVIVSNPGHKSRGLSPGFLYFDAPPPKPSIDSVSPLIGPLTGGQPVTIKGSGLQNAMRVNFGGLASPQVQILNDTTLIATTPPHGEGKVDVAVDAGSAAIFPESYAYSCWLISPSYLFLMAVLAGALGGGVHGLRSFVWNVGHGTLLKSWLPKYLLLPVLGAAIAVIFFLAASAGFYTVQGSGNMILIGLAGLVGMFSDQAAEKLKKIAEGLLTDVKKSPPAEETTAVTVAIITPNSGSTRGGTTVTISGTGFDDAPAVHFGENEVTPEKIGRTSLTVKTPPHAAGEVDVFVINKDGQSFMVRGGYTYVTPL